MDLLTSRGASERKLSFAARILAWFVRHIQQALGSLGEMWRTPLASILTIGVLGVSLTLPATLYVLVKNAQSIGQNWHTASEITLFFKDGVSDKQVASTLSRVRVWEQVESVKHISPQQALEEFKSASGFGQALEYLPSNPLPHVFMITPTRRHSSSNAAYELLAKLEKLKTIDFGKLDIEWLKRLEALLALIEQAMASVGVLLCTSVFLIIGNTIRLAIMNRKDEIEVMKLVGATNAFIQRPFLYTGFWYGVIGGVIAAALVSILMWWLEDGIVRLTSLYQSQFQLQGLGLGEAFGLIAMAISLGIAASYLSVKRHIAAIEPE